MLSDASKGMLVCLPHAGGVASDYRRWPKVGGRRVLGITYPGRESRFREAPLESVDELATLLLGELPAGRMVVFGHSLGALVGFEVARRLEAAGRALDALVVAGHGAPTLPRRRRVIHHVPDSELLEALAELGGMDPEIAAQPELLQLLLPRIRADLKAAESHQHRAGAPLRCGILALGGLSDAGVTGADLEAWRVLTSGPFAHQLVEGGHFFVKEQPNAVILAIEDFLRSL